MTLSMQISCFLLLAILGLSSAQEAQSVEYNCPVRKTLFNGNLIDNSIVVTFQANEKVLKVWYKYENATLDDYQDIDSVSVYLANDEKTLRKITFEGNTMIADYYNKPWQYAGSKTNVDVPSPLEQSPASIPLEWLPENITRVSCSMIINKEIFNYYGLKNFAISLEDTFVIDSYMLADLTILSPEQPSQ